MTQSQTVYQIMLHLQQYSQFELEGSGPDMVYYQVQGLEESVVFFVEEELNIWAPMFGSWDSLEQFKEEFEF